MYKIDLYIWWYKKEAKRCINKKRLNKIFLQYLFVLVLCNFDEEKSTLLRKSNILT